MRQVTPAELGRLIAAGERGELHLHLVESRDGVSAAAGSSGREAAYDAFATAFGLPGWFGRNLDALLDSLRDVADRHEGPWTLAWAPEGDPDPGILEVLAEIEAQTPGLEIRLVTHARPGSDHRWPQGAS